MKCPNCGFEAEQSPRCPICNANLAPEPVENPAEAGFNSYARQNVPPQQSYQQPFQQPFQQSYQQPFQQPYQQPYPQYSQHNWQNTQNPYQPDPATAKKPKSVVPIVLASIAGVVILTGIIISIVSTVFFRQSFLEKVIGEDSSQTPSYYEDNLFGEFEDDNDSLLDKNADMFYDYITRTPGEACAFAYGRYTIDSIVSEVYDPKTELYKFTVTATLENNSDEEVRYRITEPTVINNDEFGSDSVMLLSSGFGDGLDEVTLTPGKKQTCEYTFLGKKIKNEVILNSSFDIRTDSRPSPRIFSSDCEIAATDIKQGE